MIECDRVFGQSSEKCGESYLCAQCNKAWLAGYNAKENAIRLVK